MTLKKLSVVIAIAVVLGIAMSVIARLTGLDSYPTWLTYIVVGLISGVLCVLAISPGQKTGGSGSRRKPATRKASTPFKGSHREEGTVKWFSPKKGFGFISRENGDEIFVHFRSISGDGRRSLKDGQRVTYRVAENDKGLQAEDVVPA